MLQIHKVYNYETNHSVFVYNFCYTCLQLKYSTKQVIGTSDGDVVKEEYLKALKLLFQSIGGIDLAKFPKNMHQLLHKILCVFMIYTRD